MHNSATPFDNFPKLMYPVLHAALGCLAGKLIMP